MIITWFGINILYGIPIFLLIEWKEQSIYIAGTLVTTKDYKQVNFNNNIGKYNN